MYKIIGLITFIAAAFAGYIQWISVEPEHVPLQNIIKQQISKPDERVIVGAASTSTLIHLIDVFTLSKNGGYTSSSLLYKIGAFDNMSSWEQGVRHMTHDFAVSMQESFSKQNTQTMIPRLRLMLVS